MKDFANAITALNWVVRRLVIDLEVATKEKDLTENSMRICEDANRHLQEELQRQEKRIKRLKEELRHVYAELACAKAEVHLGDKNELALTVARLEVENKSLFERLGDTKAAYDALAKRGTK